MGTVIYRALERHDCPDHGCRGLPIGSAVRCGVCGEVSVVRWGNDWTYNVEQVMRGHQLSITHRSGIYRCESTGSACKWTGQRGDHVTHVADVLREAGLLKEDA